MRGSQEAEQHYLELLERDRGRWPQQRLFEHWKRHYLSELHRGDFILETLRRYLPGFSALDAAVLDIGAGDSGVPIAWARAGARAAAIEPGADSLRRGLARARLHGVRIGLCRAVAERLPFPAGYFDLVILDNVLEHVDDRERTLHEIHRVLKSQAILYLVTPKPFAVYSLLSDPHYGFFGLDLLPRSLQRFYVERVRRLGAGSYQVGRIPTRRWLRRALRRTGFRSLVPPRELWMRYIRYRLQDSATIRGALKGRLAKALHRHPGILRSPAARWLVDVGVGSNYFIARRVP